MNWADDRDSKRLSRRAEQERSRREALEPAASVVAQPFLAARIWSQSFFSSRHRGKRDAINMEERQAKRRKPRQPLGPGLEELKDEEGRKKKKEAPISKRKPQVEPAAEQAW